MLLRFVGRASVFARAVSRKLHAGRMIARSRGSILPNPRKYGLESAEARGIAFVRRFLDSLPRHARRAGIERGMWIVFEGKLHGLRDVGPGDLCHQGEREIDTRCDTAASESVPIANNAFFHGDRAHAWQQMVIRPMRRRLLALQQARGAEDERAGADGRDIFRTRALAAYEIHRLFILHRLIDAEPTRNADKIERRTVCKRRRRHELEHRIGCDGLKRLRRDMVYRRVYSVRNGSPRVDCSFGHVRIDAQV
jgi:hypothetical protein